MDEQNETEVAEAVVPDSNGLLTAKEILESDDLVIERISLPEWGKSKYAFIRTLPSEDRDIWEDRLAKKKDGRVNLSNLRAKLVAVTLCNKEGQLIFGPEHIVALGRKSAKAVGRIFDKSCKMNGIADTDIEELVGN